MNPHPTKAHLVILKNEYGKISIEVYLLIGHNSTWYSAVTNNKRTKTLTTDTYKSFKAAEKHFYCAVGHLFQRSQLLTGHSLHWLF